MTLAWLLAAAAWSAAAPAASSATLAGFSWEGVESVGPRELERALPIRAGARLDDAASAAAAEAVRSYYRNRGFLEVAVATRTRAEPDGARLAFAVREGPRYALGAVSFSGLKGVSESVARREAGLDAGGAYDPRALFRAQSALYRSRLFDDVRVRVSTTPAKTADVEFFVEERRPKWLRAGVGYGSEERQRATLSATHFNFLGRGYRLEGTTSLSAIWVEHRADFVNRHFLGTRTEASLKASWRREDREGYDSEAVGGRLGLSRALGWSWMGSAFYRLRRTVVYNIDPEIAAITPDETLSGTVGLSLNRDTSDDFFFPTRGTRAGATLERVGGIFGGNLHLVRGGLEGAAYRPLAGPVVGALAGRFGAVGPTGPTLEVPIYERFFTGGANSVRGYRERGLGPVDGFGSPLGGRYLAGARIEARSRLFWRLSGALFVDAGQVGPEFRLVTPRHWRSGAGGGLRVRTPLGPLRVDAAHKLNPARGDRDLWRVHLSVGEAF